MKTNKNDNDEKTDSDNDQNDKDRENSPIAPALLHLRGRKKSKKLTNLDISSDDGSDEDFKGPSYVKLFIDFYLVHSESESMSFGCLVLSLEVTHKGANIYCDLLIHRGLCIQS